MSQDQQVFVVAIRVLHQDETRHRPDSYHPQRYAEKVNFVGFRVPLPRFLLYVRGLLVKMLKKG